jgi:hypothetical protein
VGSIRQEAAAMNPTLLLLLLKALASHVPRGVWFNRVDRASACMHEK